MNFTDVAEPSEIHHTRGIRREKASLRVALRSRPFAAISLSFSRIHDRARRFLPRFPMKKTRVAILGRRQVGKTTLLAVLRGEMASAEGQASAGPLVSGAFSMPAGARDLRMEVAKDLPAVDGLGYADWKKAFLGSDYVWYLFRADLIAQGDADEVALVKDHFDVFKVWLGGKSSRRPKIVLIGTWSDKSPVHLRDPGKFKQEVSRSAPIKSGVVKLNNAGLVVGSLNSENDSAKLVRSLASAL